MNYVEIKKPLLEKKRLYWFACVFPNNATLYDTNWSPNVGPNTLGAIAEISLILFHIDQRPPVLASSIGVITAVDKLHFYRAT